jgi:thiamine-monophosphate kinase
MDERAALSLVGEYVEGAGDDCAVLDNLVVTTDMLHKTTDFPEGTTRYTAGWRAVGASLSDVAAMGADPTATLAVYGSPTFGERELARFLQGCTDVSETADTEYVGGDLDGHDEVTVATTAVGRTDDPVYRSGATPGEAVCVTGTVGRSGAALELFEAGKNDRANDLFRFEPRVAAGKAIAADATAMMDSSDGLARSLHQLATASGCGFAISYDDVPIDTSVDDVVEDNATRRELALHFGEDFELVFTVPEAAIESVAAATPVEVTRIGTVTDKGVSIDEKRLPDRGFTHR